MQVDATSSNYQSGDAIVISALEPRTAYFVTVACENADGYSTTRNDRRSVETGASNVM